jgi:hypothetical protein
MYVQAEETVPPIINVRALMDALAVNVNLIYALEPIVLILLFVQVVELVLHLIDASVIQDIEDQHATERFVMVLIQQTAQYVTDKVHALRPIPVFVTRSIQVVTVSIQSALARTLQMLLNVLEEVSVYYQILVNVTQDMYSVIVPYHYVTMSLLLIQQYVLCAETAQKRTYVIVQLDTLVLSVSIHHAMELQRVVLLYALEMEIVQQSTTAPARREESVVSAN